MRKMLTLLVCLLAIASVFISCAAEQTDDMASVRISVDNERSRSIAPDGSTTDVNDVKKYRFSFMKNSTAEHTFERDKDSGTYNMTGIKPDTYNLYAEALNEDGKTVATCTLEGLKLRRGANTFSISFTSLNTSEKGNVSINVKFKPSEYNGASVTVSGHLRKVNESGGEFTLTNGSLSEDGFITATTVKNNLSIGSYELYIEGKVGTKVMFALNEVIIVAPDKTTTVTHVFESSVATSTINVTDTLVTPLKGTLTITGTSDYGEIKMKLAIEGSLPESIYKDAEGNAKNINIRWYSEDYKINETNVAYNSSGTNAEINTSAFFGPAIYSAIFYLEGSEESLGSAEVKADYDIDTGEVKKVTTLH